MLLGGDEAERDGDGGVAAPREPRAGRDLLFDFDVAPKQVQ